MDDTRLLSAKSLADDARGLLDDLLNQLPPLPASHFISVAKNALNVAITNLDKAYAPVVDAANLDTLPVTRWQEDAEAGAIGGKP